MDEALYRCLKECEVRAFNALHGLPYPRSQGWKALDIANHEEWRIGALIEHLNWLQRKAADAAKAVEETVDKDCRHTDTQIWEPHLAGARKCRACCKVYNPNRTPAWQHERD